MNNSHAIPQNRRSFIKCTSAGIGASLFGLPRLAQGMGNPTIQGIVTSGSGANSIPLIEAIVNIYEAGSGAPRLVGTATTNISGYFVLLIQAPHPATNGIFYATADLGNELQLASIIGPALLPFITINELTTVAAGYAMAQFTVDGLISGDSFALQIAAGMNDNLVDPVNGESSSVMLSSPNGDQTNSLRTTLTLANLLALFVRDNGVGILILAVLARPPGGSLPPNFLQGISNIARYPQQNVTRLYTMANRMSVYSPLLSISPDAWTIVVKVNDTGDDKYLFGGPGNIAFDDNGYAWITNNVVQGTPNSSRFSVVLKPNGQPADGKQGTPKSPLLKGGLLGGGYGVGIARNGKVWYGNFGWGRPKYDPTPDGNGSVSEFTKKGKPVSGKRGYQGGPVRAQAVMPDAYGNIWIASFGNNRLYVFLKGNPRNSIYYEDPSGIATAPFDIQFAKDGTAWVTYSGGLESNSNSAVGRFSLKNGQLKKIFLRSLGHSVKAVAVDSNGNGWVASGGDNTVYLLNKSGRRIGKFNGGGINAPWGITVDGDDNVWVANFGPEKIGNNFTTSNVSKLAGVNPATRPPGLRTGDPISSSTGYTLPSAGDEVLLHNGDPLYGPKASPSFVPLMRLTSVVIDRAGNVWATNNWKPDFSDDLFNSGGDGICIFVGLAKPPGRKRFPTGKRLPKIRPGNKS